MKKSHVAFLMVLVMLISCIIPSGTFVLTANASTTPPGMLLSGGAVKIADFSKLTEATLMNNFESVDSGNVLSVNTNPDYTLDGASTSLKWDMNANTGNGSGFVIESDIDLSVLEGCNYTVYVKYYAKAPESFADDEFKFYRRIGAKGTDGKISFKNIGGMTFKVSAQNTNIWRSGYGLATGTSSDIAELSPVDDSKIYVRLTSNGGKSSYPVYIDSVWLVLDNRTGTLAAPVSSVEDGGEVNSVEFNVNPVYSVSFEKEILMDSSAVTVLENGKDITSQISAEANGTDINITFKNGVVENMKYNITIDKSKLRAKSGEALADDVTFSFNTYFEAPFEPVPRLVLADFGSYADIDTLKSDYISGGSASVELNTDPAFVYPGKSSSLKMTLTDSEKWFGLTLDYQREFWPIGSDVKIRIFNAGAIDNSINIVFCTVGGESGWKPYAHKAAVLSPGWNEIDIPRKNIDNAVSTNNDVAVRINCRGWSNLDYTAGDVLYFDSVAVDSTGILTPPLSSISDGEGWVDASLDGNCTYTLRFDSLVYAADGAVTLCELTSSGETPVTSGYTTETSDNLIKLKFNSELSNGKYRFTVDSGKIVSHSGEMLEYDTSVTFSVGSGFDDYTVGGIDISADGTYASVEMEGNLPDEYLKSVLVAAVYGKGLGKLESVNTGYYDGSLLEVSAGEFSSEQEVKFMHLSGLDSLKPLEAVSSSSQKEEETDIHSDNVPLIDFSNITHIQNAGAVPSKDHTIGKMNYSMHWNNHSENKVLAIKEFAEGVPMDWSDYSTIRVDIYSAKATQAKLTVVAYSRNDPDTGMISYYSKIITVDWTGMKTLYFDLYEMSQTRGPDISQMRRFDIVADGGWSMVADPETDLYIASAELVRVNKYDFTSKFYGEEKIDSAYLAMENSAAVFAGGNNAVTETGAHPIEYDIDLSNQKIAVPVDFFGEYLDASVSVSENAFSLSLDGKNVSGSSGSTSLSSADGDLTAEITPYTKDGRIYVPGEQIAKLLGLKAFTDGRLLCMGTDKMYHTLRRTANLGVNEYSEIVAQMACTSDINPDLVTSADIEAAKANWRRMLVGDETNNPNITEVGNKISTITTNCTNSLALLLDEPVNATLFDGIEMNSSQDLVTCYNHIVKMAYAYGCYGGTYYKNEELLANTIRCLDWYGENYYNAAARAQWQTTMTGLSNWHSWDVNIPQALIEIILCIEENLTLEQKANYLSYFTTRLTSPNSTAANYSHEAQLIAGAALLTDDAETVLEMAVNVLRTYLYVDDNERIVENKILERDFEVQKRGSGFFTDGSYVFHTFHAMNGSYGVKHFKAITDFQKIVSGTAFDVKSALKYNLPGFFFDTFDPVIYGTAMFRNIMGRSTYPNTSSGGIPVLMYAFSIAEDFDDADRDMIYSIVKAAYKNTVYKSTFINNLTIDQIPKFKSVMSDSSIKARSGRRLSRTLYNIDKTYHMRDDWAMGISMSSSRIFNYECINSENPTGWYLGDGRTEWFLSGSKIKTNATTQYWQYIDPYRLPGTTVDTQERKEVSIHQGNEYLSSKDFVGGVDLNDEYGAAAMDLESYHYDEDFGVDNGLHGGLAPAHKCDLVAKKAYFMLDDGFICLGTDVNAKDNNNAEVLTIVDNLPAVETVYVSNEGVNYGDDAVTVDGSEITVRKDDVILSGKSWLNYGDICGYVFPGSDTENPGTLKARRTADDPSTTSMESYFELWFSHGTNPTNSGYAYVVLPGATTDETKAFSDSGNIKILTNTPSVQAARDNRTGVTYIVFWQASTFDGITVTEPCMVITRETDSSFEIAVSDPTQKLESLTLTLPDAHTLQTADECASVSGKTVTYDLSKAVGRSLECIFNKK